MDNIGTVFFRTSYSNGSYLPKRWAVEYSESQLKVGSACDKASLATVISSYEQFQRKGVSAFPSVEFTYKKEMDKKYGRNSLIFMAKTKDAYTTMIRLNNEANRSFFYREPQVVDELLKVLKDENVEGDVFEMLLPLSSKNIEGLFLKAYMAHELGGDYKSSLKEIKDEFDRFSSLTAGRFYILIDTPFSLQYFTKEMFTVAALLVEEGFLTAENFVYSPIAFFPKNNVSEDNRTVTHLHQKMKLRPNFPQDSPFIGSADEVLDGLNKLNLGDRLETIYKILTHTSEFFDFQFEYKLKNYMMPSTGVPVEQEEEALKDLMLQGWNTKALDSQGLVVVKGQVKQADTRKFRGRWGDDNVVCKTIEEVFALNTERSNRLKFEYETIRDMGFIGYFLIVEDVTRFADENKLSRNYAGRGSAAGSLLSYILGITGVDPMQSPHYDDLLFERFLNPSRSSMPDIDLDFSGSSRDRVIKYLKEKYGEDRVVIIGAYSQQRIKRVLKDLHKSYDYQWPTNNRNRKSTTDFHIDHNRVAFPPAKLNQITKSIDKVKQEGSFDDIVGECIAESTLFAEWYTNHSDMFSSSAKLLTEYMRGDVSNHPSGYLILPDHVDKCVPIRMASNKTNMISHYEMDECEAAGFVKLDCLNVNAVGMMARTAELVKKRTGKAPLSMNEIDLEDPMVIAEIKRDSYGIFQFKSEIQRSYLKALDPNTFQHYYDSVALCRTGPMQANAHTQYIDLVQGNAYPQIEHSLMENALNSTYGLIIYQEQVMRLVQDMAGFTLAEADLLRRAIGRKDPKEMEEYEQAFVDGCAKNNVDKDLALQTWEKINFFSGYGFNMCVSPETLITYAVEDSVVHIPIKWVHAAMRIADMNKRGMIDSSIFINMATTEADIAKKLYRMIADDELMKIYPEKNSPVFPASNITYSDTFMVLLDIATRKRYGAIFSYDESSVKAVRNDIVDIALLPDKAPTLHINWNNSIRPLKVSPMHRLVIWDKKTLKMKPIMAAELRVGDYLVVADFYGRNRPGGAGTTDNILPETDDVKIKSKLKDIIPLYDNPLEVDAYGKSTFLSMVTEVSVSEPMPVYEVRMREPHNTYFTNGALSLNSHAVSYSIMGFYMGYLKAYFPMEYWCGVLTYSPTDRAMSNHIYELKTHMESIGVRISLPTYKSFHMDYEPTVDLDGKDAISWPAHSIAGVSKAAFKDVVKNGTRTKGSTQVSYESPKQFIDLNPTINLRIFRALVHSGFFDLPDQSPYDIAKRRVSVINYYWKVGKRTSKKDEELRLAFVDMHMSPSRIFFNTFNASKIFKWSSKSFFKYDFSRLGNYADYTNAQDGYRVGVGGVVVRLKEHTQSNGETMCFLDLEDKGEIYNVLIFSSAYEAFRAENGTPEINDIIQIAGTKSMGESGESIIVGKNDGDLVTTVVRYQDVLLDSEIPAK